LQKTISLKEKQDDFDLFFNTISPSLINKVQSDIFEDKLVLNKSINRSLMQFKLRSIKDRRKNQMMSPSDINKLNKNCFKRLFYRGKPDDDDD
jgi:predicted metallo-beta-lactamase superfamily hydrolase